jgi:hypothetical protein
MRLGKRKQPEVDPNLVLPERSETVTLNVGAGIPARVIETGEGYVVMAFTVPTRPLSPGQLKDLEVIYNSPRGRVRLKGNFTLEDPNDPDVIRLSNPRPVEVVQAREFVRINTSREVLVVRADGRRIDGFTIDVSGGGFLLGGSEPLREGEEISFRLTIVPGTAPVTGTAKVVRVSAAGHSAVSFKAIRDLDRRRLVRFIFETQRNERKRGLMDDDDGNG